MKVLFNSANAVRLLYVNLFVQCAIIVTGAIVRITKSGLGCPTWPQCVGDSIVPLASQEEAWHKYVEFGNRLLTFVLVIVAALVLISVWRTTKIRSIRILALAPILGTILQALLGGVTVLTGLHPATVAAHFMVSVIIVALSHQLVRRYKSPNKVTRPHLLGNLITLNAFVVLFLGTLVTGSGPHSGDVDASSRFSYELEHIASIHAKAVWSFCILLAFFAYKKYNQIGRQSRNSFILLAGVTLAQGFIGYVQFALGLPESLVLIHIVSAVIFWVATLRLRFDLIEYESVESDSKKYH